ncbi:olfactory receptor 10A4-like [Denticeps clupeoides]|uniref:olfactory receptor 10A4-like n=1 Tax=Denticeps clupeoides TaxID=299321 RepID=UPI0010A48B6E|nr:olfactory receptor 10A4-like [Denticeps clupeoides]
MLQENWTTIKEFILVGFPGLNPKYNGLVSTIFFTVYVTTVVGNAVLVLLFLKEHSLQKPMYGIMFSLSLADIGSGTVVLPKIIAKYWFNDETIPFHSCFMQMKFIHYFGTVTIFILVLMALDRYLAICNPLRYPVLMTGRITLALNITGWLGSFIFTTVVTVQVYQLPYCGPNRIIQCFCEQNSIVKQACADSGYQQLVAFTLAITVLLGSLTFIIYTYTHIIVCVMRVSSSHGRWKTFSTCSTQLCIIAVFYLPRCGVYICHVLRIYMLPDLHIFLIVFYTLFPPFINPFIYFFRNKQISHILVQWTINCRCR